jgi:hypothetical protein
VATQNHRLTASKTAAKPLNKEYQAAAPLRALHARAKTYYTSSAAPNQAASRWTTKKKHKKWKATYFS